MDWVVELEGVRTGRVVVRRSWIGGIKVLVDGREVRKQKRTDFGSGSIRYAIPTEDGSTESLELRPGFLGSNPQVVFAGRTTRLEQPLEWYEWVWCGAPLALVFLGGGLGGLIGAIGFFINRNIIRSENKSYIDRLGLTFAVTVFTFGLWYLIASAVSDAVR